MMLSFPLLSVQEITNNLRDFFGFVYLKEENFLNPKGEIIRPLFIKLLTSSNFLCDPEYFKLSEKESQACHYPEILETLTQVRRLSLAFSAISKTIILRGIDVSLKDLTFPEAKKTRIIVSSLLNTLKFLTEFNTIQVAKLPPYIASKNSAIEVQEYENSNQDLRTQVKHLEDFLENQKTSINAKQQALNDTENEKKSLLGIKDSLVLKEQEMISKRKNIESELETDKEAVLKANEIMLRYSQLVVDNPQAVVQMKAELKKRVTELKVIFQQEKKLENEAKIYENLRNVSFRKVKNLRNQLVGHEIKLGEYQNIDMLCKASLQEITRLEKQLKDLEKSISSKQHENNQDLKNITMDCNSLESKDDRLTYENLRVQTECEKVFDEITQIETLTANAETIIQQTRNEIEKITMDCEAKEQEAFSNKNRLYLLHEKSEKLIKERIQWLESQIRNKFLLLN